jgi:2-keto-4-pentenoate hydratase/2-oxohepta-3-ene-1,7-dioic acid hydratase in catechol pathway
VRRAVETVGRFQKVEPHPLGAPVARPRDPCGVRLETWKGGVKVQDGRSSQLIFPFRDLLVFLHGFLRLFAGDMIFTGTPAGVGFVRRPQVLLQPGDTVRMEISGLGVLENPIKDA